MAQTSGVSLRVISDPRPRPLLPSPVLGTLIFVIAELMMFGGLISAFSIVKAGALGWPPPGQPRLPVEATAFNTAMLLASAGALYHANRAFLLDRASAKRSLFAAIGLGAFFVCFQGYEWLSLIGHGLTLTSSNYGSFFYLIVGAHGLHALAGLAVLSHAAVKLRRGLLVPSHFVASQVFWYFVVGLWPVLYLLVYL
jgi:heme/copper-type cytochrome/quinol oxidase subunit 3